MKYLLSFLEKYVPAYVWDTDKTDGTPASKSAVSPVEVPTKPREPGSVGSVSAPAGESAEIEGYGRCRWCWRSRRTIAIGVVDPGDGAAWLAGRG